MVSVSRSACVFREQNINDGAYWNYSCAVGVLTGKKTESPDRFARGMKNCYAYVVKKKIYESTQIPFPDRPVRGKKKPNYFFNNLRRMKWERTEDLLSSIAQFTRRDHRTDRQTAVRVKLIFTRARSNWKARLVSSSVSSVRRVIVVGRPPPGENYRGIISSFSAAVSDSNTLLSPIIIIYPYYLRAH